MKYVPTILIYIACLSDCLSNYFYMKKKHQTASLFDIITTVGTVFSFIAIVTLSLKGISGSEMLVLASNCYAHIAIIVTLVFEIFVFFVQKTSSFSNK